MKYLVKVEVTTSQIVAVEAECAERARSMAVLEQGTLVAGTKETVDVSVKYVEAVPK